jgi:hypothetical protein
MELMLLRTFQSQVALQCKFLLRAALEVNKAIKNQEIEGTFYALQNMLNAGANISKALWGQGGKLANDRKAIRDSIGIGDDSPLKDVTMRNNFEHFDERLDQWWKQSANHNNADLMIGSKAMIAGLDETDKFRHFDPGTTDIVFWGQEFNLQRLVDEAQKILPKLEAEANKSRSQTKPPEHQA